MLHSTNTESPRHVFEAACIQDLVGEGWRGIGVKAKEVPSLGSDCCSQALGYA